MGTTVVDFTTNLGDVVIDLYNNVAPLNVANFLSYAENMTFGDGYDDTFFHRLVAGFVLQGGGYVFNNGTVAAVATAAPVQNEFSASHPNVAGTVAMALSGTDPNSATDQFFINLVDNSSYLDTLNGGFTVIGTVTAASFPVVEAIANLPTVNGGGAFANLPVTGTLTNNSIAAANLVTITNVAVSSLPAPCYRRGTHLRTPAGEIRIERLQPGDRVITARGEAAIRWVGHRRLDTSAHPNPESVWPIRIAAHAFAANIPMRDLFVSPDHAVFIDGVLIPAQHLVNGRSIAQLAVDHVEYWHIELDRHDIVFAEGLAAETYLDTGNRAAFADSADHLQLHPGFAARTWGHACAELLQAGPRLAGIKALLFARAEGAVPARHLALRVLADDHELMPDILAPGRSRYQVPIGAWRLQLRSPSWMPAACYAESLDRRRLGIRLLDVLVDDRPSGLEAPMFGPGFYPPEATIEGPSRWTNGDAWLVLPGGARTVTLSVADGAAPYIAPNHVAAA